jgi:cation:H+ antiporter
MLVAVTVAAFVFNKNGWLLGWFNPMSLVIIAIYVFSVIFTPKTEEKEEQEEVQTKLTVKQIWILLAVFSVILIGASIGVTLVTEQIVTGFNIGHTFGGSLFLGVATSLPEVTATISLCKKKNFDAAYGDILGSCVFNIIILGLADAISFNAGPLYTINSDSFMLMIGTAFCLLLTFLSILFIRSKYFKDNLKSRIILYSIGALLISSYLVYLALASAGVSLI